MNRRLFAFAGGCLLAALATGRDAHALGPVDLEVAAEAGLGTTPSNTLGPSPLGFGFGGRAGVVHGGFYGGVEVIDYLGGSEILGLHGGVSTWSKHAVLYGVEVGYGKKWFGTLTVRPTLSAGDFNVWGKPVPEYASGPGIALFIEPGITVLVSLASFFVGADANLLVVPGLRDPTTDQTSTDIAFTLHGQAGVTF